jgi:hypothetical protein
MVKDATMLQVGENHLLLVRRGICLSVWKGVRGEGEGRREGSERRAEGKGREPFACVEPGEGS